MQITIGCGCVMIIDEFDNSALKYCSLHSAAPDMLAAINEAILALRDIDNELVDIGIASGVDSVIEYLEGAADIAKAKGESL